MDASPLQGFRPPLNLPVPIYTPGPGERHCDSKVSCQRTQHNVPNKAETWNAQSRGEYTNYEATTPSWLPMLQLKDDVQSVLRSLSPQCLWASQTFSHNGMQIDLIRYEPLTLSLRHVLNSFSNNFLAFYSYEGFWSSDIRKNEA